MGDFGWAYVSGANLVGSGIRSTQHGSSIQYLKTSDGEITGSSKFTYRDAAGNGGGDVFLSGSMYISGTIKANVFDVITTTSTEIIQSGSTTFGDGESDTHTFNGSLTILSGGLNKHYYHLQPATDTANDSALSYTIQPYDCIIGVSCSNYTQLTLPTAVSAGFGRVIIIKDEYLFEGRTRGNSIPIALTASGGDTIEHTGSFSMTGDSTAVSIYSDGVSNWFIY